MTAILDNINTAAEAARRIFHAAETLAPAPQTLDESSNDVWARHYTAQALAAHAAFVAALPTIAATPEGGSRPDLGYLVAIATASTAAAVALVEEPEQVPITLWDLTPELGALNGEWDGWLIEQLDGMGVNPADIDPRLVAADFASPSRPVPTERS